MSARTQRFDEILVELAIDGTIISDWSTKCADFNEGLSEVYSMVLQIVTDRATLDPRSFLGADCTLSFNDRRISGIVNCIERGENNERHQEVRLHVAPALGLLRQQIDSRT